jgi:hypothetical protein
MTHVRVGRPCKRTHSQRVRRERRGKSACAGLEHVYDPRARPQRNSLPIWALIDSQRSARRALLEESVNIHARQLQPIGGYPAVQVTLAALQMY